MQLEELFNQNTIIDLSFFNFRNAVTAAFFADQDLRIKEVNNNFKSFFPVLGNVSNAWFPDVLVQLGVEPQVLETFQLQLISTGRVLIPKIEIQVKGKTRIYSLLSTQTKDTSFAYLNGVQGQFIDRTHEFNLRREREILLEQKVRDREVIAEKTKELERVANRLAKYLAPQVYKSIFESGAEPETNFKRKNLTIFFSDIVGFTDISDGLEPERLAEIMNTYLSEMSEIAMQYGGTLDKFIGDAILIFFGDPETDGDAQDATRCVHMAKAMQQKVQELQPLWKTHGVSQSLKVRMGINTGYCTVGNFGSDQRLEYTAVGGPVNLAARLQTLADPDTILMSESTRLLIGPEVQCSEMDNIIPKGFTRPVKVFRLDSIDSKEEPSADTLHHKGEHVEVNISNPDKLRDAIEELRSISEEFEKRLVSRTDTVA